LLDITLGEEQSLAEFDSNYSEDEKQIGKKVIYTLRWFFYDLSNTCILQCIAG